MDIKEIREWVKELSHYYFETKVSDLDDTVRLFTNLKTAVPFLLSEVERLEKDVEGLSENLFISNEYAVKLEKENAALREVVEAAKAYVGSVDINFQYAKGSLIELNDVLEKIKEK